MILSSFTEIIMTKTVGERITKARKSLGFTQAVLAKKLGVTQQTIGNLESGRSSSRHLADIAAELEVSYEYLKTGQEKTEPKHTKNLNHENSASYEDIQNIIPAAFDRTIVAISKRLRATGKGPIDIIEHREIIAKLLSISVVGELANDYSIISESLELLENIK